MITLQDLKQNQKYFKTQNNYSRFPSLAPLMRDIAVFAINWLQARGVYKEYYITETCTTLKEDQALNRVSDTHRTCRAIDLSTSGLSLDQINGLIDVLNAKYGQHGALVHGKPMLVIYHNNGNGWHFHIQLNRSFAKEFK